MRRNLQDLVRAAVLGSALLALGAVAAYADDSAQPGRAARLSNVEGQVSISLNGQQIADHALANLPLFEGTQIATGDDGRAEIQFEDGAIARVPPASSLTLTVLKPDDSEIDLNSGVGYFELQGSPDHPLRLRFGANTVTASGFTVLRVQLDQPPGSLAVFSGNAHLDASGNTSIDLHGGESVDLAQYVLAENIEPDSWDAWNSDRDQAITSAEASTTAATNSMPNSNNPAWSDLNNNGTWYNTPNDGYVWSPYDASNPGWDPYGNGYWVNEPGYGYIWAEAASWGYLPYQCGMWNWYTGFGWGWAPGSCSPWWAGGGGWNVNIGYYPTWYQRPFRPRSGPWPKGGPTGPHHPIPGRPVGHEPIIAVNRHPPAIGSPLPPRDGRTPVNIGGIVFNPVGVLPRRPGYDRSGNPPLSYHGDPKPVAGGPVRPIYAPPQEPVGRPFTPQQSVRDGHPVNQQPDPRQNVPNPGYNPFHPAPAPAPAPTPAPVYRPPSGGGNPHPSGGGSPPPSGGGGGGGSHPSGGGGSPHPSGGGGGGGSHPSGGGGSHPK